MDFAERDECRPVLLRLSLATNLEKPELSALGDEREAASCDGRGVRSALFCVLMSLKRRKRIALPKPTTNIVTVQRLSDSVTKSYAPMYIFFAIM